MGSTRLSGGSGRSSWITEEGDLIASSTTRAPPAATVGSKLSMRRLTLQDQAEEKLGMPLSRVWAQRELKVLDLCSGLGSVPWTLARLGIQARVFEVELDAAARKVEAARAPGAEQLVPHDIWHWASPAAGQPQSYFR